MVKLWVYYDYSENLDWRAGLWDDWQWCISSSDISVCLMINHHTVLFVTFFFDITGFETRMPDREDVEYAEIILETIGLVKFFLISLIIPPL